MGDSVAEWEFKHIEKKLFRKTLRSARNSNYDVIDVTKVEELRWAFWMD